MVMTIVSKSFDYGNDFEKLQIPCRYVKLVTSANFAFDESLSRTNLTAWLQVYQTLYHFTTYIESKYWFVILRELITIRLQHEKNFPPSIFITI